MGPDPNPDDPPLYHFYVVTAWDGGAPQVANDEHSEIAWFTLGQLSVLPDLAERAYVAMAERALTLGSRGRNIA